MSLEPLNFDIHVGQRLSVLRGQQNLNQGQLSAKSGIPLAQIQQYETGEKRMKPDELWQLSQVLDVEVGRFFDGLVASYSDAS